MRTKTMLIGQCCLCLLGLFVSPLMADDGPGAPGSAAAEQPIGHWTFDRLDGQRAPDSTGNRPPAAVHGATPVAGIQGGALAFDGLDDYVPLGDLGQFDAVTIAFWMKGQDVGKADDWQGLVTSDGWEEGMFHIPMRAGKIEVYLHLGEMRRGRLSSRPLKNGIWYHVAVVADRQSRAMRLFLNGCEDDEDNISSLSTSIKLTRQVVGREFDVDKSGRYFRGTIDDVRIYDRALEEVDIQGLCPGLQPLSARDPRNICTGLRIPDEGYCDMPYVVVTKDGNWLCTLTTGSGHEGAGGQHVVSTISSDKGRTWTPPVDIEPASGPVASWVVPLAVPGGRVYGFYAYNGDKVDKLPGGEKKIRADMMGWYCYKYSDDNGRSWSNERYRLPMRVTACDRGNDWQGKVQIFWGMDKPEVFGSDVMFAFTKVGRYMLENGEGWLYRSDNILTESDIAKINWKLLPDGEHGIRMAEFGSTQEEHNMVPLGGDRLYMVYRTTRGYPCQTYSCDGGRTWEKPVHMTYTPGGRQIKTPRACPMLWRCENGKFLFWFHNHGGKSFKGRNPVWIAGGAEKDGQIFWSQPEILLYDPQSSLGMSYPDLIEQDGRYWVTETQKTVARVHEIDPALLEGLWNQGKAKAVAKEGLVLDLGPENLQGGEVDISKLPSLAEGGGFSIDFQINLKELSAGRTILDSRDVAGMGFAVKTAEHGTIRIEMSDGKNVGSWDCDRGIIKPDTWHHVTIIVDGGPSVISFLVDGVLCDGDTDRVCGWGRFGPELGDVSGSGKLRISPSPVGQLKRLRVYDRYLRTSEAIANFHVGM
ncbi:MAG: exo-alpha-sialidase [Pirellulaceae bacterium]|nr:exo-alpha-sialidase [Pirellulaceae bacterium]